MKIGMSITRFGPAETIGGTVAEIAARADESAIHSLWVMDHLWQIGHNGPAEDPMLECYTVLPYLAGITSRVQLGALVTAVSYRHPGLLLKTLTTLDVLSRGRAWLGIGAAWNADEATGLGIPFPPRDRRYRQLEETLQIAERMWAGDETPFDGSEYQLRRPLNVPHAVRSPRPPILIGGSGERRTLRLVAQYADACNLFYTGDPDEVAHKLDVLRRHCEAVGRPYDEIVKSVAAFLPEDPAAAVPELERIAELGIDLAVVDLPGGTAEGVEQVAGMADAVASFGRPAPAVLEPAGVSV
jgi:F420-dependent oxidoreductase-like protein